MGKTDFSKITACGGCCDSCEHFIKKECKGCIATGGERVFQGRKSTCEICACCKKHEVSFCGICKEFPCDWIVKKIDWDNKGIEKLRKLGEEYAE